MERYVVAADDLSEGAFLAHPTMLSVQLDGSGFEEQITEPSAQREHQRLLGSKPRRCVYGQ